MISIRLADATSFLGAAGGSVAGTSVAAPSWEPCDELAHDPWLPAGRLRRCCERIAGRRALLAHVADRRGSAAGQAGTAAGSGVSIRKTVLGAPFAVGADVGVSLSHTGGDLATAVFDRSLMAGIDIERADRDAPAALSRRRTASTPDSAGVPFPPIAAFSAREAAGKALGIGLLAAWEVYDVSAVVEVSADEHPLWRVDFVHLPFLSSYITVLGARLVLACAVASFAPAPRSRLPRLVRCAPAPGGTADIELRL